MSSAKFKALIKFYRRNTDLMRGIGHRIRQERLAMGWTQREVAEQLGMKQPNIAAMEKGRVSPTIAVLDAVCGWRGQGLPWLLFGEEEAEPRVAEEGEAYGRAEPTAVSFPVIAEVASDADLGAVWRAVQPPDSCPLPSGVSLVRVVGDALQPLASDGQMLIVAEGEPQNGDFVMVATRDDRRLVRRWGAEEGGTVVLEGIAEGRDTPLTEPRDHIRRVWIIKGVLL